MGGIHAAIMVKPTAVTEQAGNRSTLLRRNVRTFFQPSHKSDEIQIQEGAYQAQYFKVYFHLHLESDLPVRPQWPVFQWDNQILDPISEGEELY
jgi:hypothetical protein